MGNERRIFVVNVFHWHTIVLSNNNNYVLLISSSTFSSLLNQITDSYYVKEAAFLHDFEKRTLVKCCWYSKRWKLWVLFSLLQTNLACRRFSCRRFELALTSALKWLNKKADVFLCYSQFNVMEHSSRASTGAAAAGVKNALRCSLVAINRRI